MSSENDEGAPQTGAHLRFEKSEGKGLPAERLVLERSLGVAVGRFVRAVLPDAGLVGQREVAGSVVGKNCNSEVLTVSVDARRLLILRDVIGECQGRLSFGESLVMGCRHVAVVEDNDAGSALSDPS